MFWPRFKVTFCDLEHATIRASRAVSWNMKSSGKRAIFRFTA